MAKTVKSCKQKGRRLQQHVVDLIYAYFTDLLPGDVVSATMGETGTDIKLSPKAKSYLNFDIECKNTEKLSLWKAWDQVLKRLPEDANPMLIIKKNRTEPLMVIPASLGFQVLSRLIPMKEMK